MWFEILFFVIVLILYFVVYVELKVNQHNDIHLMDNELMRTSLHRETFLKQPFYFNGQHINEKYKKSSLKIRDKFKNYTKYEKDYEKIRLLEPYTRFQVNQFVYFIQKGNTSHLPFLTHSSSVNFYIVKKGNVKISFIHPKYKDNVYQKDTLETCPSIIQYVKDHEYIQCLECFENTVIYVPNDWILFVENNQDKTSIVEVIEYKTILNQLLVSIKKNIIGP